MPRAGMWRALFLWLAVLPGGSPVRATVPGPGWFDKVDMTPEQLRKTATHVIVGEVQAIYERAETVDRWQYTRYVAEVKVVACEKGEGLQEGDLAYARYWRRKFLGDRPPPSTAGHRGLPAQGQTLRIYLARNAYDGFTKENQDGGFNVIGANGFEALGDEIVFYLDEVSRDLDAGDNLYEAKVVFLNNIQSFFEKFIDSQDETYKDDPATARYFVEYRLRPFLRRFPSSAYAEQASAWIKDLEERYDAAAPFPDSWWDHELVWAMEERLEHHGHTYELMQGWLERHPGQHAEEARDKRALSLRRGQMYWTSYVLETRLQPVLEATPPNYQGALTWARKAWQNLRGIPELETGIRQMAEEIQRVAREDGTELSLEGFDGR